MMAGRNSSINSVERVSHDLVSRYTEQPLRFAYYEHFVTSPPMRQSRRASSRVNRLVVIFIIVASGFLLLYKNTQQFTQIDRECIQDEWQENNNLGNTIDDGSNFRIAFTDIQQNYTWLHLPNFLENSEILMIVSSNCDNFARRNILRKTWMNPENSQIIGDGRMKALFLVGINGADEKLNAVVLEEAKVFGDMIVIDLEDNYLNLSYKTISLLLYSISKTKSPNLIGKIDEDVLFYPDQLTPLINDKTINTSTFSIYGEKYEAGVAVNHGEDNAKWQISKNSFKCSVYPSYLSGPTYFLTRKAAKRIVEATKHRKFISVEDVFITGLLAGDVGIKKNQLPFMYMIEEATNDRESYEILAWHTKKRDQQYIEAFESLKLNRCKSCRKSKNPDLEELKEK
ncbi:Hexosyltransferase [Caenorhabditis elegans]|uniref:Hexosyltransferase n=1 Tax=Caenorhabditis elegans TaxID=6239 RepID=D0Z5N7_CAEEL|nr:Hexosyltransferase [Caenorhabditis elegans]CBI63238.1 Hexosyltransferase [Caenorhabditis elegans]|eukprot:NP_001255188.1 Hexosyltransferase [Caenorhabditis elegans]